MSLATLKPAAPPKPEPKYVAKRPDEISPSYAAALGKLNDVRHRLARAESRLGEIQAGARRLGPQERAQALLDGKPLEEITADLRPEYERLLDERRVLRRAAELQEKVTNDELRKAYRASCAELRKAHRMVAQRTAAAVEQLRAALAEEIALRDALDQAGVDFVSPLVTVFPGGGMHPGDPLGRYDAWLGELNDYLAQK